MFVVLLSSCENWSSFQLPRSISSSKWPRGAGGPPLRAARSRQGRPHAPFGLEIQMFNRLLNLFLEILFYATGSSVLHLFGYKDASDLASWMTGVALWG